MIVRISGEGQYELSDEDAGRLRELEKRVEAVVESGRKEDFPASLRPVLGYVRENGKPLPDDALEIPR